MGASYPMLKSTSQAVSIDADAAALAHRLCNEHSVRMQDDQYIQWIDFDGEYSNNTVAKYIDLQVCTSRHSGRA